MRPFRFTDCWWQPIAARNPPERDRKYAELPRSWFICGEAETFGRHFAAALLSGVSQVVQRQAAEKNWVVLTLRPQLDGSGRQPASRQVRPAVPHYRMAMLRLMRSKVSRPVFKGGLTLSPKCQHSTLAA